MSESPTVLPESPTVYRVRRANWYGILQAVARSGEEGLLPRQIARRVKIENEFVRDFRSFEEHELMCCVLVLKKLKKAGLVKEDSFGYRPSKTRWSIVEDDRSGEDVEKSYLEYGCYQLGDCCVFI